MYSTYIYGRYCHHIIGVIVKRFVKDQTSHAGYFISNIIGNFQKFKFTNPAYAYHQRETKKFKQNCVFSVVCLRLWSQENL